MTTADIWSTLPSFPGFYLEFDAEPDSSEKYEYEMKLLQQYERVDSSANADDDSVEIEGMPGKVGWAGEAYEKIRPKHYNKSFKHFQRTVETEPEQCLRYAFGGTPLFFATDGVHQRIVGAEGVPRCGACGGRRVFECQVMPAVLSVLPTEREAGRAEKVEKIEREKKEREEAERVTAAIAGGAENSAAAAQNGDKGQGKSKAKAAGPPSLDEITAFLSTMSLGMEFGTVLIFTCENDCEGGKRAAVGDAAYFEEWAAVQAESWR
ncbi:programmed cell death protein [Irineochytrium annulatum]|nr:programmed cell death protein [Irineochytrium annulatum]